MSFALAVRATVSTPESVTLVEAVEAELNALRDHYKALAVDGMTWLEVWELLQNAVAAALRVAKQYDETADNATLTDFAVAFASKFYDDVIAPIDLKKIPNLIETRFVDPAIKHLFMALVEGSIKSLINVFNRTGWFDTPGENGADSTPVQPDPTSPVPQTPGGFVPY